MPIDEALSPFPVRAESSFRGALPAAELAGRVGGEGVGDPPKSRAGSRASARRQQLFALLAALLLA